jgi:hypothetical protein
VPSANRLFIGYHRTVRDTAAGLARAIESHLHPSEPGEAAIEDES